MNKKSLDEWELEKGIKIKTKKRKSAYTENQFKKLIIKNQIKVKTDKGLEFLQEI